MKQGITITRDYDRHDTMIVRIQKRRGKLGLSEILRSSCATEAGKSGAATTPFS